MSTKAWSKDDKICDLMGCFAGVSKEEEMQMLLQGLNDFSMMFSER